jgi:hypothetical protein
VRANGIVNMSVLQKIRKKELWLSCAKGIVNNTTVQTESFNKAANAK